MAAGENASQGPLRYRGLPLRTTWGRIRLAIGRIGSRVQAPTGGRIERWDPGPGPEPPDPPSAHTGSGSRGAPREPSRGSGSPPVQHAAIGSVARPGPWAPGLLSGRVSGLPALPPQRRSWIIEAFRIQRTPAQHPCPLLHPCLSLRRPVCDGPCEPFQVLGLVRANPTCTRPREYPGTLAVCNCSKTNVIW